jgi:hypothetical protein
VVSFVTMVAMVSGAVPAASGPPHRVFPLVLFGWIVADGPLTPQFRAAGMPASSAAFQTPVEVL